MEEKVFGRIAPHKRLTINVHLDGMRETHDYVCARRASSTRRSRASRSRRRAAIHVVTNTTIFKETKIDEVEELCDF